MSSQQRQLGSIVGALSSACAGVWALFVLTTPFAQAAPAKGIGPIIPGICAPITSSATPHVQWAKLSFSQAIKRAKKTQCPILVDMYATWCYPCKKYDKKVFNKFSVAQFVHQYFIPLRRDGMKGEGDQLKKRYNCVTFPCILVIGPSGKEIERVTRFMEAGPFMRRLEAIRSNQDTLASLLPKLKKRPKDAVLRYRIGRRLAYRGNSRCIKHLMFVANNPPKGYPWLGPMSLYVLGRIYYRNTKRNWAKVVEVFGLFLKKYPNNRRAARVRKMRNRAMRRLQRRR